MNKRESLFLAVAIVALSCSVFIFTREETYDCTDNSCCKSSVFNAIKLNNFSQDCQLPSINNLPVSVREKFIEPTTNHSSHYLNALPIEELRKYVAEKAEDGKRFVNWEAPDFSFITENNTAHRLKDYRGSKVALIFYETSCPECASTIAHIPEIKENIKHNLTILPIDINRQNISFQKIGSTLKSINKKCKVMVCLPGKATGNLFKCSIMPSVFLIDQKGFITQKLVGTKDKATLENAFAVFAKNENNSESE